jgi:protein-disulfide isomerase
MKSAMNLAFAGVFALAACQQEASSELAVIADRLEALESKVDRQLTAPAQRPARPKRPDPKETYAVPVADDAPYVGGRHAKVTLVVAQEFACPYCAMLYPVLDALSEQYVDDELKIVPTQFVVHPQLATTPALAVCAAAEQDAFEAYERMLWARAWQLEPRPQLDREQLTADALVALAEEVGVDPEQFRADMNGEDCKRSLRAGEEALRQVGVGATPTVYLNGRPYAGPRTVEGFTAAIERELEAADQALARGVALEDLYAEITRDAKTTL